MCFTQLKRLRLKNLTCNKTFAANMLLSSVVTVRPTSFLQPGEAPAQKLPELTQSLLIQRFIKIAPSVKLLVFG